MITAPPPKKIKKTTLRHFLRKRALYYIIPNVCFNFLIAYTSFQELGYTHFFAGHQSLARLTLPMAIFLPVVLTMDIIKRVILAIEQKSIALAVDGKLKRHAFITRLCIAHGLVTGLLVLSCLLFAQYSLTAHYKLNATAMAALDALLAGLLSVIFTYLPIRRLRKHLYKPTLAMDEIPVEQSPTEAQSEEKLPLDR
ncbi:hypothetical protein K7A41_16095 [Sphingobacterium sp. InxBP1]|uniref:hypothetical protein n=1 Tax=Sphingobacterium sp. InxBP1 TaxID=2870328 RepID=UPI002244B828|nr:hypothetical protein [Sphingobacterium sp. InxBP1]MCW8312752.1 hypothetical protein [Sphingobacterium sp. InxBP1]